MLEPNPDDPLNKEAANMLASNRAAFEQSVRATFAGRSMKVAGQYYDFPKQPLPFPSD